MEQVAPPATDQPVNTYYMPHHGVIKESSSTTKLRVVFNASCKTSNGKSLNEQMLVGPTIQPTIWTTLLRWRNYQYAFTADIEKMYRMVRITKQHQDYQRIIWRDNPDEPLKDYALKTVTFGTASAPYLAIRTLQQLANDENDNFPAAAEVLRTQCYVDDVTSGSHTLQGALKLQTDLINLLKKGGFNLRKWTGNTTEILENVPLDHREIKESLEFSDAINVKTLGLRWYPGKDEFQFTVALPPHSETYTKRKILSEVASLFDPFGWLAPTIVVGKFLLQQLWRSGCSWDEPAPKELQDRWNQLRETLPELEKLAIPRWTHLTPDVDSIELHGFADASEHGYAAVVYLKIKIADSTTRTTLLVSRTRVAPIKQVSIARLELCAAVTLARTLRSVCEEGQLKGVKIYAWTDSLITLAWIRSCPTRWKTFVANRTSEIHSLTDRDAWRYVPTGDNPADCASRGLMPSQLVNHHLWWTGPAWLKEKESVWPEQPYVTETQQEIKPAKVFQLNTRPHPFEAFSTFSRLKRVLAYMLRFAHNSKPINKSLQHRDPYLTSLELTESERRIIKIIQERHYVQEMKNLRENQPLPRKSPIVALNPILDDDGILRVGGRLHAANQPYQTKHPAILPTKDHVTKLMITHMHEFTLHGGAQLVLTTLRNKYWLTNARNMVKGCIRKCVTCIRSRPKTQTQIMGNLPAYRVTTALPFQHVGIDFAGPIDVKASRIRNSKLLKGYICVFICMSTKAIHVELTTDLSADSFIAAFRRFTSRRGRCTDVYSDNGTNFVKASKQLDARVQQRLNNDGIKWHFNPPSAPHFGGIWEAGVKSVKTHLQKILKETSLTYEELYTLLCQIEACLNSRPLLPLYQDPTDHALLTPGHFLTGRNIMAIPETAPIDANIPMKRWQYLKELSHQFWKVWSTEYLHTLQQRAKWDSEQDNLENGNIVLIKNEQFGATKWPLGIITDVFPGKDGKVRVVQVRSQHGTYTRPVTKLCRLPITNKIKM